MGWPVSHSLSPRLHNYWLRKYKIDGAYIPLAVEPENLEKALRALPALGLKGCNLTIPHKEKALKYMDSIDPLAKRIGAVNTVIVHKDGSLEGKNTDAFGFTANLIAGGFQKSCHGKTATVLGAGGAARAVIVALQDMGFSQINIVNRSKDHAEQLAASLSNGSDIKVVTWDKTTQAFDGSALLINTTPLGMQGQAELKIDLTPMPSTAWVTDIVYAPLKTKLLLQAQQKRLKTIDGLGMLLHQARPGFAAWFGVEPIVTENVRQFVVNDDEETTQ